MFLDLGYRRTAVGAQNPGAVLFYLFMYVELLRHEVKEIL